MPESERVAVIIPCFNDGAFVRDAVESIREDEPIELVVVDDGSTDPATFTILRQLETEGVRVIRHSSNSGIAESRMTGLCATSARYVFPLDADDRAVRGALAAMADRLDADGDAAVCYGDYREFGERELVRAVPTDLDPFRLAYTNEYPVSALYRRDVLDAVGGWRGRVGKGYEDWHLWMSLAEHGEKGVHLGIGRLTYQRRLHRARALASARRQHRLFYRQLRTAHPMLFSALRRHRRQSSLSPVRRLLYPVVYGGRRRFAFESRVKLLLDAVGVWTLRRRGSTSS